MEQIVDRAAINGQKVKILCRNSYQRKCAHEYAEQKGLSHRSIVDYTKFHINRSIKHGEVAVVMIAITLKLQFQELLIHL